MARELHEHTQRLTAELATANDRLREVGAMSLFEVQERRAAVEREAAEREQKALAALAALEQQREEVMSSLESVRKTLVAMEDLALLQEAGVYEYTHPLSEAVAYEAALKKLNDEVKAMTKKARSSPSPVGRSMVPRRRGAPWCGTSRS